MREPVIMCAEPFVQKKGGMPGLLTAASINCDRHLMTCCVPAVLVLDG
jgi:hypothetical protein